MSHYVELRARSAFSFLQGASTPEDMVRRAAELDLETMALSDRDGLYGAVRFHNAATAIGVRPILGADISMEGDRGRLLLLVKDRTGYQNLCKLITKAHAGRPKGTSMVSLKQVQRYAKGLLCLTGGVLDKALSSGGEVKAAHVLNGLKDAFGSKGVWVELNRHLLREQIRKEGHLVELAKNAGLGLIATNDVRYAKRSDHNLYDVLTCLRHNTTLERAGRLLAPNDEYHLKSTKQMMTLFADLPEAVYNTLQVADMCRFTLRDLGYAFPGYPVDEGESQISYLHRLVHQGARRRYKPLEARHKIQIAKELSLIAKLDLAGYFLVVWDIVRFCRQQGILAQGRGSAANSAVCYCLGITAVDPIGMGMLFERFLSEERGSWPDIDLDLPSGAPREKVIQYVYKRYGPNGAAMTANVITFRQRMAVRQVSKVLGFDTEQWAKAAKLAHGTDHGGWGHDMDAFVQGLEDAGVNTKNPIVSVGVKLIEKIQNLPRHLGQHSGGMVLAGGRLDEIVPLEPASMPGRTVVQWDKDDCADMGIIKVDLLGLGMLKVLSETVKLAKVHEGVELDLADLPQGDPKVYSMLQKADTVGVFQVESRAQMATLPRMKPSCYYDLVIEVALIRPGPIVGKMVHPYLNRRAGREPITYPHPSLKPILERTLGIALFQEQIMRVAMVAAGFSAGQAAQLRRAMTHKRSKEKMASMAEALRMGMAARGITGQDAEQIIQGISSFALYGFPESHAASFALIVYASAYLKAHHPASFYCALLNAWPMGFYHPATIVKDAQRHGQTMRPVDVLHSRVQCSIEHDSSVRLGLKFVSGLRGDVAEQLVLQRQRYGFRDLRDLQSRCSLEQDELATLAELGALAGFGFGRRQALWQVAGLETEGRGLMEFIPEDSTPSPVPIMDAMECTVADLRCSGVTTGPHPIAHDRCRLRQRGVLPAASVIANPDGKRLKAAGLVITRQRPPTAKGMCFLTLEDETGLLNVVLVPEVFERYRRLVITADAMVVDGVLEKKDGVTNLMAKRLMAFRITGQTVPPRNFH